MNTLSNKKERETKEAQNLFADPKFARQAWRSLANAIVQNPARRLPQQIDKEGNPTLQSDIDQYCYQSLTRDIKQICKRDGTKEREPTELEMILACQAVKARFDTQAATFIRDTAGAKPVDESKIEATVVNEYEALSDAELEALARFRAEQQAEQERIQPVIDQAKTECGVKEE